MWLTGSAGSGKTALSQTTAEELEKESQGRIMGCHFFFRTSEDGRRSDGNLWGPNVVQQMVRILPETLKYVERAIERDDAIFDQRLDRVLESLFLNPILEAFAAQQRFSIRRLLRRIFGGRRFVISFEIIRITLISLHRSTLDPHFARLIVVDGLDECSSAELQVHILETIAQAIPKLPIPIKFLIASRPETHIRMAMSQEFQNLGLRKLNLDEDQDARTDIEEYIVDRFETIRKTHPALRGQDQYATGWPSRVDITALVEKSSLTFIFATTVMNYISHKSGHPVDRLDVILGLAIVPNKQNPYLPLDTLYRYILSCVDEENHDLVWKILGILYLAGKSESAKNLKSSPQFLDRLLHLRDGTVSVLLDPLVSLLTLPEKPTESIKVQHASFFDFLLDSSRSGDMGFRLLESHEAIALWLLDEMEKSPQSQPNCELNYVF